jgi:hypothetical protein
VERSVASRKTERFIGPDSCLIKLDMPLDASLQGVFKDNRATRVRHQIPFVGVFDLATLTKSST